MEGFSAIFRFPHKPLYFTAFLNIYLSLMVLDIALFFFCHVLSMPKHNVLSSSKVEFSRS